MILFLWIGKFGDKFLFFCGVIFVLGDYVVRFGDKVVVWVKVVDGDE